MKLPAFSALETEKTMNDFSCTFFFHYNLRRYNTDEDDEEQAEQAQAVLKDRPTHEHWARSSFGFKIAPQWMAASTAAAVADIAASDAKKVGKPAVAQGGAISQNGCLKRLAQSLENTM
jgi:hypothetical protein